jgi:hypothetical protein
MVTDEIVAGEVADKNYRLPMGWRGRYSDCRHWARDYQIGRGVGS